jgi:hypothetical protein
MRVLSTIDKKANANKIWQVKSMLFPQHFNHNDSLGALFIQLFPYKMEVQLPFCMEIRIIRNYVNI